LGEALADAAITGGAEVRMSAGVAGVIVAEDRVVGVRLENGEELAAPLVMSSLGAQTSMHLAGVEHYDVEAVRRIRSIRAKGNVAKLNLILSGLPDMPHSLLSGRMVIAPSVSEVERAFNPVKYGERSTEPVIEAVIPTLNEPGNPTRHVLSACIQYVPHVPVGGWSQADRAEVEKRALDRLETVLPGLSSRVEKAQFLTPLDIEASTGAPGGHWHHGELSFDQLLTVRPANGFGNYRFGPRGYFLCGASCHPGGDVTGAPGHNAAQAALEGRP
ncbi:phytoene desaturase family protein, partial [Cribrihabitans sp. XS_ASV171]